MIDERRVFEHAMHGFVPPEDSFERLVHRRNRKRRNQRIAAGVVGMGIFLVAIWVLTTGPLDRATPVVPGDEGTEPTMTGPSVTGPAVTVDFVGLPPEGSQPSSPREGELVDRSHIIHVGWVYVYADGRVISQSEGSPPVGYREQRLTPAGVRAIRWDTLEPADLLQRPEEVPAFAWEDATIRPYVPSRYAVCLGQLGKFPDAVSDLLRGKERTFDVSGPLQGQQECFDVTTDTARAVEEILLGDERFHIGGDAAWGSYEIWSVEMRGDNPVLQADFAPILPHGTFANQPG